MSFSEEFAGLGRMLRATVCRQGVIRADAELAQRLGEPESVPVFLLERVRFVDDEPMALQRSYIAHRHVPGIEGVDFGSASLYEVLSGRFGLWIDHADERIVAGTADASAAELLGVAPGSPVFEIERRSYQRPQWLLELVDSVYRADRYEVRQDPQVIDGLPAQASLHGSPRHPRDRHGGDPRARAAPGRLSSRRATRTPAWRRVWIQ